MSFETPFVSLVPTLSTEQWREDVHVFARELVQRHNNPWHFVSQVDFEQAVAQFHAQIPQLAPHEVVVGIQRLAAMIGDGHTHLGTDGLYHRFPLEVFWFGGELRVVRAAAEYQRALGARILKIENYTIGAAQRRVRTLVPQAENRWFESHQSALQLMNTEPLAALGLLPHVGNALFTCQDDAGDRFSLSVAPVAPTTTITWIDAAAPLPLYLQHRDQSFWFTAVPESQTVYVNFRGYHNLDQHAQQLWSFVEQHAPQRLVIDMRQNGGGNYTLARQYLIYKAQFHPLLNRPERLFVVTGRATFSAAMTNATDFRRETEATLVGEPTGARPNGYQELDTFTLPHSQLSAHCSMLRYRFQEGPALAVMPDVHIDPDWLAYKAGRDPVMEWIQQRPLHNT